MHRLLTPSLLLLPLFWWRPLVATACVLAGVRALMGLPSPGAPGPQELRPGLLTSCSLAPLAPPGRPLRLRRCVHLEASVQPLLLITPVSAPR